MLEDQLVHEASHDSLTALANRALFRDRVDKVLRQNDGRPAKLTVLFLDLDGFKEVNDSLGHATGDMLLIQVAERLRSCVRPIDTVARLGGDEFAVLVADKSSERDGSVGRGPDHDGARRAVQARRPRDLRRRLDRDRRDRPGRRRRRPPAAERRPGHVPRQGERRRAASSATTRACTSRSSSGSSSRPSCARRSRRRRARAPLPADARARDRRDHRASRRSPAGSIRGAASSRRASSSRSPSRPGLIRPLGRFGPQRSLPSSSPSGTERSPGTRDLTVSVNISGRHLEDASLIDDVQDALARERLEPARLVLEMTESVLMGHTEENVELLARLKELGRRASRSTTSGPATRRSPTFTASRPT